MEQKWQTSLDLLAPLGELKSHGFDTLLQSLFWDLKVAAASFPGPVLSTVLRGREGWGGTAEAKTGMWKAQCGARCREAGAAQARGPWRP